MGFFSKIKGVFSSPPLSLNIPAPEPRPEPVKPEIKPTPVVFLVDPFAKDAPAPKPVLSEPVSISKPKITLESLDDDDDFVAVKKSHKKNPPVPAPVAVLEPEPEPQPEPAPEPTPEPEMYSSIPAPPPPNYSKALRISDFYIPRTKQKLFHESTAPYRGQIGGFGSGKTRALLMEAIRHCLTIPGCNALIIRRTHKDLNKTIVNLLLNPGKEGLGIDLETLCGRKNPYNHTDHVCYFQHAGGVTSKLFFGYCDEAKDVNQYLSTEYVFIGIEEAGEFPLSVFTALCGRNRCPVKSDVFGRAVRSSVGLATNPMGIGYGWIKKLFVEHKPAGGMVNYNPGDYFMVHSTLFDNPTYASDTAYIAKLEALPEAERQKKLFGNLESMEGIYYSNFDPNPTLQGSHVVQHEKIQFHPWHPRWIGFDWGFAPEQSGGHALAIIFFAKADVERADGVLKTVNVAYDELVLYNKTEAEIVAEIKKKMNPGDQFANIFLSHEQFGQRSAARTVAMQLGDELIKLNLPRPTQSDRDREGGWKLGYNLFESDDLVISTRCSQLIGALQILTRDPDNIEDILKVDSVEDDLADAFRYGLKGYLSPGSKPMELQHEEFLHTAKSNSQRFMMDMQWQQDHKYENQLALPVPKRVLF